MKVGDRCVCRASNVNLLAEGINTGTEVKIVSMVPEVVVEIEKTRDPEYLGDGKYCITERRYVYKRMSHHTLNKCFDVIRESIDAPTKIVGWVCGGRECSRKNDCRHYEGNAKPGTYEYVDMSSMGSGTFNSEGCTVVYWCGDNSKYYDKFEKLEGGS